MARQLTHAAPWNDTMTTPDGYHNIAWTAESIAAYEAAGGWFKCTDFGYHPRYNIARGVKKDKPTQMVKPALKPCKLIEDAMSKLAKRLTPAERMLLLAQLEAQ